ncbi:MAG: hypothetical protein QXW00_00530 [Candidatus Woesearchaeota archaeon]
MKKVLVVRCPFCSHNMKYAPKEMRPSNRKRCVYCGRYFKVEGNLEDS